MKCFGHQSAPVRHGQVLSFIAVLEQAQSQLGILGDAPLGPAADALQRRVPDQRHRAVLNDGVALVAHDHADVKEAAILGVAHRLERVLFGVTIVLRGLHDGELLVGERGHQRAQPVRLDFVVAVDHRDDASIGRCAFERVVQRAGLESLQWRDVIELEALAQVPAMPLHRLPHGGSRRVLLSMTMTSKSG